MANAHKLVTSHHITARYRDAHAYAWLAGSRDVMAAWQAHRTLLVFVPLPVFLGSLGGTRRDQRRVRLHPRVQRKQVLQR